jgi:hypothetical protein
MKLLNRKSSTRLAGAGRDQLQAAAQWSAILWLSRAGTAEWRFSQPPFA